MALLANTAMYAIAETQSTAIVRGEYRIGGQKNDRERKV